MGLFVDRLTLEEVRHWFASTAATDEGYLCAHFSRFVDTYRFAQAGLGGKPQVILDIGAHWLHHAFLYANDGHRLVCADNPITASNPDVKKIASTIGASLVNCVRLDKGDGICEIPDDSIDLIIFSEIIEHLAFNPIRMWREIHRCLRPGGRIIVTTPNSVNFRTVRLRLHQLIDEGFFGCPVDEIMSTGTLGHHWKEYSLPEILKYFSLLSTDFEFSRHEFIGTTDQDKAEFEWYLKSEFQGIDGIISGILRTMREQGHELMGDTILTEFYLNKKTRGIAIQAPWEPE